MKDFTARCTERDDTKDYVMHEVCAEEDGVSYKLDVVAESPDKAIDVARWVEKQYWQTKQ